MESQQKVPIGASQWLIYREAQRGETIPYDGYHIAIYINDFLGAYRISVLVGFLLCFGFGCLSLSFYSLKNQMTTANFFHPLRPGEAAQLALEQPTVSQFDLRHRRFGAETHGVPDLESD